MKKTLFIISLIVSSNVLAQGFTSVQKNEMTGQETHTYINISTNESEYSLTVVCEPKWGLSFKYCGSNYGYLSRSSCSMSFNYKFDNGAMEKKEWLYDSDLAKYYASERPFIKRLTEHNRLVISKFPDLPSMPTPVFDISDLKHKIKKFPKHCQFIKKSANKDASGKKEVISSENTHFHNGRKHSHALPLSGIDHKHGNGAIGTKSP